MIFKIGDKVKVKNFKCEIRKNKYYTGEIYCFLDTMIGIRFDEFINGHSLINVSSIYEQKKYNIRKCTFGHGYYVSKTGNDIIRNIEKPVILKKSDYKCMFCFKEFKGKKIINQKCPHCMDRNIIKVENI